MASVSINAPKTPVTKGSNGIAAATTPNVCKMPGPPAPFVPTPLPNIGRSALSPKGYSKRVKIEGNPVAIRGATFASQGDAASKGTGGGLVSANTHGVTKFVGPGSMNVKIEGKNVHLLADPMLNNCGPSGSPPNAATLGGIGQASSGAAPPKMPLGISCEEKRNDTRPGKAWDDCQVKQLCNMVKGFNESKHPQKRVSPSPSETISAASAKKRGMSAADFDAHKAARQSYTSGLDAFAEGFAALVEEKGAQHADVKAKFNDDCQHKKWVDADAPTPVPRSGRGAMHPDHVHDAGLGGPISGAELIDNLSWADGRVNTTVGASMKKYDPDEYPGGVEANADCGCDG